MKREKIKKKNFFISKRFFLSGAFVFPVKKRLYLSKALGTGVHTYILYAMVAGNISKWRQKNEIENEL